MSGKKGFTLLEVLVVVIIIGILAALGWSSMNELIQTNKAKEAARTLTAFAERAVAESKMRKDSVTITIVNNNTLEARLSGSSSTLLFSQTLANGFSAGTAPSGNVTPPAVCNATTFSNNTIKSQVRTGLSGIDGEGRFIACSSGGNYCGSAVKRNNKNTFTACIKRRSGNWEAL